MLEGVKPYDLEIIAGPCSVDSNNVPELYQLAEIETPQGLAIYGARVVGLKSRTAFIPPEEGVENNGMGIDFQALLELEDNPDKQINFPSVEIAEELTRKTGLVIASEIMMPEKQMPQYVGKIPEGQGLFWSPSVNSLGWQVREKARIAKTNGWDVGIKNGKFVGISYEDAIDPAYPGQSQLEKTWSGQATYANNGILPNDRIVLMHRGVDVPEKGDQRNALVHEIAGRVKEQHPGSKLYLDPTHSLGPKLRDKIVDQTLEMMTIRRNGEFLYDGVIFEAGTSKTDTHEHITLDELSGFANTVAEFRQLRKPPARGDVYVSAGRPALQ